MTLTELSYEEVKEVLRLRKQALLTVLETPGFPTGAVNLKQKIDAFLEALDRYEMLLAGQRKYSPGDYKD